MLVDMGLARTAKGLKDARRYLQEANFTSQRELETYNKHREAYSDTGRWLFEKPQFILWSLQACGLLVVVGAPGCGKAVLAAA